MSDRDSKGKEPSEPRKEGFSRRSFLQGAVGAAAAGVALLQVGRELGDEKKSRGELSSDDSISELELNVNGKTVHMRVPDQRSLLLALREDMGLTGTKKSCNLGQCGACTILLDGKPVYSCMMLAADGAGHEITTIEGISRGGKLHPVQEKFIEHMGSQCGHCTPGMIMSGVALLNRNPSPGVDDVKHAIAGNLCRCGNYNNEIAAILDAANVKDSNPGLESGTTAQTPANNAVTYLNSMIPAIDSHAKATGQARYSGDIGFHSDDEVKNPLYAKVVRSQYRHAEVISIDDREARKLPGYRGLVTWRDTPDYPNDRLFFNKHARYIGDAVGAVAAEDQYTAQRAIELLDIKWRELEPFPNAEENLRTQNKEIQSGGPVASLAGNPTGGKTGSGQPSFGQPANLPTFEYKQGDVTTGFQEADSTLTGVYRTPLQCPLPIELHCCTALWNSTGLTLWDSQQSMFPAREIIGPVLGLDPQKVRIVCDYVGGGFGGKCTDSPGKTLYQCIAAVLSKKTGRPVRLEFTLKEEIIAEDTRNPMVFEIKSGHKKDGSITALECRTVQTKGGYASDGPAVLAVSGEAIIATYRAKHFWFHGYSVYTNSSIGGEMRGFGNIQGTFAREMHISKIADMLGMNPLEYRLKNLLRPGDMVMIQFDSHEEPLDPTGAEECLKRGAEAIGWDRWAHPSTKTGRIRRGLGIYSSKHLCGRGTSNGLIWVDRLGKVHLPVSIGNVGTESHTGVAAVAAEVLAMPIEDLDVTWGDTSKGPWEYTSDDSRSTHCVGKAVYNASMDLLRELKTLGAVALGADQGTLEVRGGRVWVRGTNRSVDFRTLAGRATPRTEFIPYCNPATDISPDFDDQGNLIMSPPIRVHLPTEALARKLTQVGIVGLGMYIFNERTVPWGAAFADVEVDMSTGQVKVLKIVSVMNAGRVLYRRGAEAQLRGGIEIGAGFALMEDLGIDPVTGVPIYNNLHEYHPMTVLDFPEVVPILVEVPSVTGPYGAMGLGDNCCFPPAATIGTAVHNATGVWIEELPLTVERVYTALKAAGRLVA